jgi:hypothetical protein
MFAERAATIQEPRTRTLLWLPWGAIAVAAALCLGVTRGFVSPQVPEQAAAEQPKAPPQRNVVLAGKLDDEKLIALTAALAGRGNGGVFLLDAPQAAGYNRDFLSAFCPEHVIPIGTFADGRAALEHRIGCPVEEPLGSPAALFTRAEHVVVCPAQPRRLLLQAACLAGIHNAPLWITHDNVDEAAALLKQLLAWRTREVFAVGSAARLVENFAVSHFALADEQAVSARYLRHLRKQGPIETIVVTNPADVEGDLGGVSVLAPWLALQHRAALLCTNDAGDNTTALVQAAVKQPALAHVDAVLLAASLKAIPTERRPNPVPGKDAVIEMEPLTPAGTEPFSFAVGRLFHEDLSVLPLLMARQGLLSEAPRAGPRRALVVSNPGGGLALLETFSRNTAKELRNCGYETTALFNEAVTRDQVQALLPSQDIFLWEGHYRTMVDRYEMPKWTEPLQPALIFLQSCLALNEKEAQPLLRRGALSVIGSATRMYSGSGGAFTLSFFNGLNYDQRSLGGSLRHAKNYLLAYSLLKEQLLGDKAKLGGANLRSAWAFTLWGDPTLKLPRPQLPEDALEPVHHKLHGNTLVLTLPNTVYDKVINQQYQAQMWPNARLAGLLRKGEEDERTLVPFLFAEVRFPNTHPGKAPILTSKVPHKHWVFCWDARCHCGYVLVAPRPKDEREVRFHVGWSE